MGLISTKVNEGLAQALPGELSVTFAGSEANVMALKAFGRATPWGEPYGRSRNH